MFNKEKLQGMKSNRVVKLAVFIAKSQNLPPLSDCVSVISGNDNMMKGNIQIQLTNSNTHIPLIILSI